MKENQSVKNMILYLGGNFASLFGTSIYGFAMSFFILSYTESAIYFSLSMVLSVLPRIVLSPFAGVLADNHDRKKLVLLFDTLSGLTMLTMFAISMIFGLQIWMVYISTVLLTTFNTLFGISFGAAIPNLVNDEHLGKINSLNQTVNSLSGILGPITGGMIYFLVPVELFLLFNGISFLLSTLAESFINFNYNLKEKEKEREQTNEKMLTQIKEGFVYLKNQKMIFELLKGSLFINFFFGAVNVGLPIIIVLTLQCNEKALGTVESGFAIGMFLFSLILAMKKAIKFNKKNYILLLLVLATLEGLLAIPVLPLTIISGQIAIVIYYFIGTFTIGCFIVWINVPASVAMQEIVDPSYRGRITSLVNMMSMAIMPLGTLLYGFLYELLDAYLILIASGVGFLGVTLTMAYNLRGMELDEAQISEEVA